MAGYGFGYRFARRSGSGNGPPAGNGQVLYGPNYGPKGPKKIITAVWNQGDVGYCYGTNNLAENLPALWASRGVNTWKLGHPDGPLSGRYAECLAAVQAAGLMMIAAPRWEPEYPSRPDLSVLDFRSLALNDPYWRVNWIAYQISDEPDLGASPWSVYVGHANNMALGGVTKPTLANFTRRMAIPASSVGSASINFYEAFNAPQIRGLSIDSYEYHLGTTDAASATPVRTSPAMWVAPWHAENAAEWPRFTGSITGVAVHVMRNGPLSPGKSDSGNLPVQYPPIAFNTPPFSNPGIFIAPQPYAYAPGDKSTGHYVATGRVDFNVNYPRGGRWQPGRFLRNEGLSGFVHGSSSLYIFPQTVGQFTVTGYIDAGANTLTITAAPPFNVAGAMRIIQTGFTQIGWIRRDTPQLSGTPGGAGVYALDPAKVTPVAAGSVGSPVTLTLSAASNAWGDDSNAENISELTNLIANLNRMQAHPTGGNLMIDTAQGGRRAFTAMRCPELDGDVSLYKDDMTRAPVRASYTAGGVPIPDALGYNPLWDFGWPMGFEGFRVTGDDGAVYIYVRSLSNGNAPTFFPGFAALGLPARAFGAFEMVGFRRVGAAVAVEMTGSSAVLKAGVDDGAATWFFIESSAIVQNEGNSGSTAYTITIRRGGNVSGTNTVNVATSGTGINPANATDFGGGTFPSGTVSFAANEVTKTFTANVQGDAAAEFDETFKFTLSSPSGAAVLVASGKSELTCTIVNDDAAVASSFVWLGSSLSAAPAITGAPAGATYLNGSETSFVTRGGLTMRSINPPGFASNVNPAVFGLPYWGIANTFAGVEFEIADLGSWEIGVLGLTDTGAGGLFQVYDYPGGVPTLRYSYTFPNASLRVLDTDGTAYTNPTTAAQDALNNLTFVPITVSEDVAASGKGRLRIVGGAPFVLISGLALRKR